MIERPKYLEQVREAFRVHPVCALLGPRQGGKTTLARILAEEESSTFFGWGCHLILLRTV